VRLCGLRSSPDVVLRCGRHAERDVLAHGTREEEGVLLDGRNLRAQRLQAPVAHIHPIHQHPATVRVEDAVDEPGQRRLTGAGLPDDGDGLAGPRDKADIPQHRRAVIAEADMLEGHFAPDGLRDALRILVQLGLGVDGLEDAPRAGDAELHQVESEDGDEGREAQRADQPQESDGLAERDAARAPEQQPVQQRAGPGQRESQLRPVQRLDFALPHVQVTHLARVARELPPLVVLLYVGLDDFHARDGLGQPGVQLAKLLPDVEAHRLEPPVVVPDRDSEQHEEEAGHEQQLELHPADEQDGDDHGHRRIENQHQARAEHDVQHAHVIGRARHDVADALAVVERLALAKQAAVQLVARIALDALRDELDRVVARQPGQPLHQRDAQHRHRNRQQRAPRPGGRRDEVERAADLELNLAVDVVIENRGCERGQREERIARQMRQDPAHRALPVVAMLVVEPELSLGHAGDYTTEYTEHTEYAGGSKWQEFETIGVEAP